MRHECLLLFAHRAAPRLVALTAVVLAAQAGAQGAGSDAPAAPAAAASAAAAEPASRPAPAAAPTGAATATPVPAPAISRTSSAAPKVPQAEQVAVIEDDGARIEETRRRGQVVHVQVQSKLGNTRSYDITVKPSAEPASQRGVSGRAAWQLFSF